MESPVMTVKEARKLLGKQFFELADEQIERIIATLNVIAIESIKPLVPESYS